MIPLIMSMTHRVRFARGKHPSVRRVTTRVRLAAALAIAIAASMGLTSPVDGSVAGPSYVPGPPPPHATSPTSPALPSSGGAADVMPDPVQTRERGWTVPIERLGGPSTVAVSGQTPTLLRLRLPIGTRATNLRIARVEMASDTSTASVIVAVNGIDVERVRARAGHPLAIPLTAQSSDATSGADKTGELAIEIRLEVGEPDAVAVDCGPGSVRLRGLRLDVNGTPATPFTIDELLPRSLEGLTIVLPSRPTPDVATAAIRLASAAKFRSDPGVITDIVRPEDPAANAPSHPWRRLVRLQPTNGPGRIIVDGPTESTFTGRPAAIVALVDLLHDPTMRSLPASSVRIASASPKQPDVGSPAIRSVSELAATPLVTTGNGEAEVAVDIPRRVGFDPVGTLQGQVRGFAKADRPVAGMTVSAEISGLTVGTALVDGRSGAFTFSFAVRHLADSSPHRLVLRATSSDNTVAAACPGRLAEVTIVVDPQSTLVVGPQTAVEATIGAAAFQLPIDPIVTVDPNDASGLSFAAATLAMIERARDGRLLPVVETPDQTSSDRIGDSDIVVVTSAQDESVARPDIGVQPLRIPGEVAPALVDSDRFASLSVGTTLVRGHRQVVLSAASSNAGRLAASETQNQVWPTASSQGLLFGDRTVSVPSEAVPEMIERFDAGAVPPNELGLAWPEPASSGHRVLIGMAIGAVAVLILRIIIRTHRTVSRVPQRPAE